MQVRFNLSRGGSNRPKVHGEQETSDETGNGEKLLYRTNRRHVQFPRWRRRNGIVWIARSKVTIQVFRKLNMNSHLMTKNLAVLHCLLNWIQHSILCLVMLTITTCINKNYYTSFLHFFSISILFFYRLSMFWSCNTRPYSFRSCGTRKFPPTIGVIDWCGSWSAKPYGTRLRYGAKLGEI